MANVEVNKFVMRAVNDPAFRAKFTQDPVATAKAEGASADTLKAVGKLDVSRLQRQFDHLSRVSTDLLSSIQAAGHSSDHLDRSNIHDNDGNIHDKAQSMGVDLGAVINPADRALNPAALRDALKDPAILKEFETNPALKAALKNAVR